MEEETRKLRHKLANVEQQKAILEKVTLQAADEIDDLADADCSEPAIARARMKADRLRAIANTSRSGS